MGAFRKKLPNYWRYALQILALYFFLMTMPSFAQAANGTVATVSPVSSWITWCGNFCESPTYSSAAEACSYYNSPGRTYTVSNVPYSELGMTYPGSFRCIVTTPLGSAYSGWVLSKGNWSCPANSTGTTTCTCNTNYVPDATGTSCVPAVICPVTSLNQPPFSDACSNSLEEGKGVDVNNKCDPLTDDMEDAASCIADKINKLSSPAVNPQYTTPSATVRTAAYQDHLLEIWTKSKLLDPIMNGYVYTLETKQVCAATYAAVLAEKQVHGIDSQPSSSGDAAPHVEHRAIDVPRRIAKALIKQVTLYTTTYITVKGKKIPTQTITSDVEDYIHSATVNPPACDSKISWGGRFKPVDRVHFQLPKLPK